MSGYGAVLRHVESELNAGRLGVGQHLPAERKLAEERRRHEEETTALRRDADERVEEQHLSTEEARRRAEIAENDLRDRSGQARGTHSPGDATLTRDSRDSDGTRDPRI